MESHEQLELLFKKAREEQTSFSYEETKNQFLKTVSAQKSRTNSVNKSIVFIKKFGIMTLIVCTLGFVFLLFFTPSNDVKDIDKIEKNNQDVQSDDNNQTVTPLLKEEENELKEIDTVQLKELDVIEAPQIKKTELMLTLENRRFLKLFPIKALAINEDDESSKSSFRIPKKESELDDDFRFPVLTDEEIKNNHKQKKKMLTALKKTDKKTFAYVPSGSFKYMDSIISVQAFYIQKTEVTNLEYRTFLFDLLINDRKEAFLRAMPDQTLWVTYFGEDNRPMQEEYFSHGAYDNYPVVNISREGATMYCKWLTEELSHFAGDSKKELFNPIRIPTREEWVKAASFDGKYYLYPWEGSSIKNEEGSYLANHKPTDSTYFDDGGFFTVNVHSYLPNDYGLFNMSGNVAEMVWNGPKYTTPGTAGGGWMNRAEELKIIGNDPYKGVTDPHPNIGFRVVMTYLN